MRIDLVNRLQSTNIQHTTLFLSIHFTFRNVNKIINNDIGNPNRLLEEGSQFELPTVVEDNLNKYNHELRKLNISK